MVGHDICFINIKSQSVRIKPFYDITKLIIDDSG